MVVWLTLKFFHFSTRPPNAWRASTGLGPIRRVVIVGNSVERGLLLLLLEEMSGGTEAIEGVGAPKAMEVFDVNPDCSLSCSLYS